MNVLQPPCTFLRLLGPPSVQPPLHKHAACNASSHLATCSAAWHACRRVPAAQCPCSTTAWSVVARSQQVHYSNAHTKSLGCLVAADDQLRGARSSELVQLQDVRCGTSISMDAHCCSLSCTMFHYNQSHLLCWCGMNTRWLEDVAGWGPAGGPAPQDVAGLLAMIM
jgi:hypothetical protein